MIHKYWPHKVLSVLWTVIFTAELVHVLCIMCRYTAHPVNNVVISPWRGRQGLYCQAEELFSSPALSRASPLRSATSAPGGGCIYAGGPPLKMNCASQEEGKLRLVMVHTDEARSWVWGPVICLTITVWVSLCTVCACVVSSVSTQSWWLICVSAQLFELYITVCSFYWLTIDPVPINKPLFNLCVIICVLPHSEQTNRAYGLFLKVNPTSLIKCTNSLNKVFTYPPTCGIMLQCFLSPVSTCLFALRRGIFVKKPRTDLALAH